MPLKFKIGDVCLTKNTRCALVNNGVLVAISAIDPTVRNREGNPAPYLIRRIDGQPLANTTCRDTGHMVWYGATEAWCEEYKLTKPECDDLVPEWDALPVNLDDQLEAAIIQAGESP